MPRKALLVVACLILLALAPPAIAPARAQTVPTRCDELGTPPAPPEEGFDDVGSPAPPPNVIGDSIDAAAARLNAWNLENWDGTAIVSEIPDPLPVDRTRAVAVDQAVVDGAPPEVFVCAGIPVPELSELTLEAAQAMLEGAGLFAGTEQDVPGDWTVATQDPGAGLPVPFGTRVLLALQPPQAPSPAVIVQPTVAPSPEETGDAVPDEETATPLVLAAALAALVLAAALRSRARRRWAITHVTATAGAAGAPEVWSDGADDPPALVARLELHADPGTQTLEEVKP